MTYLRSNLFFPTSWPTWLSMLALFQTVLSGCGTVDAKEDLVTCSDGLKNGDELGIDCGGESCEVCQACTTPGECASGLCVERSCATTQRRQCTEVHPPNASSTQEQVVVEFTTGEGWSEVAECEWECNNDFFKTEQDTCINERQETCLENHPDNAISIPVIVTNTFTTAKGWTTTECDWNCNNDFFKTEQGTCINERQQACLEDHPDNATSISKMITVTYTTADGWTTAPACDWQCNNDFFETEQGTCINERREACIENPPDNATAIPGTVTVAYTTKEGWATPGECDWECNNNFFKTEQGTCINKRQEACLEKHPDNATSIQKTVTIDYTTADGWDDVPACDWQCNNNFFETEQGTCINERREACVDNPPDNATSIPGTVTTTYTTADGWTTPAECDWKCDKFYIRSGDQCFVEEPDGLVNNVVFIPFQVIEGDFGGVNVADKICQAHAKEAGLPENTYVAWLSTKDTNAIDRLKGARGWVRPDGRPVFDTLEDIVAGNMFYSINQDETGGMSNVGGFSIWTGSGPDGTWQEKQDCDGWSSKNSRSTTPVLRADITGKLFHPELANEPCHLFRSFYCFGRDINRPVFVSKQKFSRVAFVTKSEWIPAVDRGVDFADKLCQKEADVAGLEGEFVALLADEGISAMSRLERVLDLDGLHWARLDGFAPPTPSAFQLFSIQFWESGLFQHADGSHADVHSRIWAGAARLFEDGTPETTCNGWNPTLKFPNANSSRSRSTNSAATRSLACDETSAAGLVCLQK